MKPIFVIASLAFVVTSMSTANGQMTLDVAKITCDQYVHNKIGNAKTSAAWLSGYYHGKNNSLTIDLQAVEAMAEKVQSYCYEQKNWEVPVIEAIARLGGGR